VTEEQSKNPTSSTGDVDLAEQLLSQAGASGRPLVGPGGLLTELTQYVLERALDRDG
jgi:hypothetical protein